MHVVGMHVGLTPTDQILSLFIAVCSTQSPDMENQEEDVLHMSLAESLAEAAAKPDHSLELANKDRKIKSLTATIEELKAENKRLEYVPCIELKCCCACVWVDGKV